MIKALIVGMVALGLLAFRTADGWEAVIVPIGKRAIVVSFERSCVALGIDYRPIGNRFQFSSRHSTTTDAWWTPGAMNRYPGPKSVFVPIWMIELWMALVLLKRHLRRKRVYRPG